VNSDENIARQEEDLRLASTLELFRSNEKQLAEAKATQKREEFLSKAQAAAAKLQRKDGDVTSLYNAEITAVLLKVYSVFMDPAKSKFDAMADALKEKISNDASKLHAYYSEIASDTQAGGA
jgi:hypothetical protein